jgi:hydrogenase maturation protease
LRDWNPSTSKTLILAYGNPLRGDDGLAWQAADQLESVFIGGEVEIIKLHQLAPELAEVASRYERVIFIDAAEAAAGRPAGDVRVEEITSADAGHFSHHISPACVVALGDRLFGRRPQAFYATVAAECFDPGEVISDVVAEALPELIDRIKLLVQNSGRAVGVAVGTRRSR